MHIPRARVPLSLVTETGALPRKPNKSLDNPDYVTVWLRIMRHRSVTYSPDAAFSALADPTRRAMLDLLRRGSHPAGKIARAFPVSRPAISRHLAVLRRAHLVEERREGRQRMYQINPQPLKAVDSWLESYRGFWITSLNSLKTFVEVEYQKELQSKLARKTKEKRS